MSEEELIAQDVVPELIQQEPKRLRVDIPILKLSYHGKSTAFLDWLTLINSLINTTCELEFHEKEIRADSRDGTDAIYFYITKLSASVFRKYRMIRTAEQKGPYKIILNIATLHSVLKEVRKIDYVKIRSRENELMITIKYPAVFVTDKETNQRKQTEFESSKTWTIKLIDEQLIHTLAHVRDFAGRITMSTTLFYDMLKKVRTAGEICEIIVSDNSFSISVAGDQGDMSFKVNQFTKDQQAQKLELASYKDDGTPARLFFNIDLLLKTAPLANLSQIIVLMLSEREPVPGGTPVPSAVHITIMFDGNIGVFKFWMAGHEENN